MTRIEPCPFCGARDGLSTSVYADYVTLENQSPDGALHVNMDGFGWYWVMCSNCHAQGPKYHGGFWAIGNTGPRNYHRDRDKTAKAIVTAVEAWNQRDGRLF